MITMFGMERAALLLQCLEWNKQYGASPWHIALSLTWAGPIEVADGLDIDFDVNEPTMGEKLANLNLLDEPTKNNQQKQDLSSDAKPPSADSVHVMLKQALHADDRALLLDCLYTQDEKVYCFNFSYFVFRWISVYTCANSMVDSLAKDTVSHDSLTIIHHGIPSSAA